MEESSLKKFHRRHRCGDGYVCYDGALKEMQGGRKHKYQPRPASRGKL